MGVRLACATATIMAGIIAMMAASPALGDALPRRGILGISAEERNGAVVAAAVLPNTPAQAAGLAPGDRIASIDGITIRSLAQFLQTVRHPAGERVTIVVIRNGQTLSKTIALAEYPKESDPHVTTLYDSLAIDGSLRRVLITVPNAVAGRRPAIFFIGGIGCYSIDVADPQDSYRNLAQALSRRGFVTMRLEKSGIGDSQGPPCPKVDFVTESRSYSAALRFLAADSHVDPARVYLLGHSIGTIIAPRLAQVRRPAGIVVIAAVARSWFEYELINWRRQLQLSTTPPSDYDSEMQQKEWCMHRTLIEKQSVKSVLALRPACKDELPYPVTIEYLQQVAGLNILSPWTHLDVPVLAIYGSADFVTDLTDHQLIVDTVNKVHPGNATLTVIDDMDHYLWTEPSQQASLKNAGSGKEGRYNPKLSAAIITWLCAREECAPPV
jgi:alpha-beta hydrolase superfamily lysophospholipase